MHVDTRREHVEDVLPALLVPDAGGIRVGKFIHQQQRGPAGDRPVEVELAKDVTPVRHLQPRQHLDTVEQSRRFTAAVGFDDSGHDVRAVGTQPSRRLQHGERFANPG